MGYQPKEILMTAEPIWEPVEHGDLLDLITSDDYHYPAFLTVIVKAAAKNGGKFNMNDVRPALAVLELKPQSVGRFIKRAKREGVIQANGWCVNEDHRGGNAGKPQPEYILVGAA